MRSFDVGIETTYAAERHVERILAEEDDTDFSVACWEPGQISPFHCHPDAVEVYLCLSGGGTMRTPSGIIELTPGRFVIHPRGELHEFENGTQRSVLFRVRSGTDMAAYECDRRGDPSWRQTARDAEYFSREHSGGGPAGLGGTVGRPGPSG
jgi:mannose-6-phosphate isomerase-like protein (cupin superfamily)